MHPSQSARSPYSDFFTAAHLRQFELADHGSDRARVIEVKAGSTTQQLSLPFTEWALYQEQRSSIAGVTLKDMRAASGLVKMCRMAGWHPCYA
jgi:hypothetical protein